MKTQPARYSSEPPARIEPVRRLHSDEMPLMSPAIGVCGDSTLRASKIMTPQAELAAARRRIEQLDVILREARIESERRRLQIVSLHRLQPASVPPKPARSTLLTALAGLAAGTLLGFATGQPLATPLAAVGTFAAFNLARWLEASRRG